MDNKNSLNEQPLNFIVGEQLSAVVFVQDYIQLQFDGFGLTAITHPIVKVANTSFKRDMSRYRDMLCERIGKIVLVVSVREDKEVLIEFDDESVIAISLNPEDYRAAEAVIFDNGQGQTWIW